ncbi:MAG TPA: hypothetical protein VNQ76_17730 [Planctomicrobium sp.]|nr:hypothetical protein [Planctomicrobium sp.]
MFRPLALTMISSALIGVLSASGCHHSYYQQPYGGFGGYPTMGPYESYPPGGYQAPIQTLTPGQPSYVPGGMSPTTIPPGGQPYQPGTGGGLQPIPDTGPPPTYSPPGTSPLAPSPYYGPGASMTPSSAPVYSSVQPAAAVGGIQQTGWNEPSALSPPTASLREVRSPVVPGLANASVPAQPLPAIPSAMPMDTFAPPKVGPPPAINSMSGSSEPFGHVAPASQPAPAAAEGVFDLKANKVENAVLSAFAHDAKFRWLRGVVSREPQNGTWSIIYNNAPDATDRWAGHLSLSPSPELERLRNGEVVTLRGQIDNVLKDHLGKPVYVVTGVEKVTVVE